MFLNDEELEARAAEDRANQWDKLEREQCQIESGLANKLAARGMNGHGLEIPPLPERPVELIELTARRAQLGHDREALETELHQMQEKRGLEQQDDVDALDEAAERIAAGKVEATAPGATPEAVETLRVRLDVARRAEGKVAGKIVEANARHNRALAKTLKPLHRAATRRIHKALLELEAANAEESAVRYAVPGVPLQYFSFPNLGTRGPNGCGHLRHWISYAKRFGMLAEDDNPAAE